MSLIHTCELNKVNAFDYRILQLQKNVLAALAAQEKWMPWNYAEQLRPLATV